MHVENVENKDLQDGKVSMRQGQRQNEEEEVQMVM